ncbi:MAG: hypothetical protein GY725_22675 [bacterium]|nr:hypothetical protein [bacterium]
MPRLIQTLLFTLPFLALAEPAQGRSAHGALGGPCAASGSVESALRGVFWPQWGVRGCIRVDRPITGRTSALVA